MSSSGGGDGIAVIGLDGRFPGAAGVERFWELLCDGAEARTEFTDEELAAAGVSAQDQEDPRFVRGGFVMDDPEDFDEEFFGISPAEARLLDPQHRVFLQSAWHAVENAGYTPEKCGESVGVFAGCGPPTYLMHHVIANPGFDDLVTRYQALTANDKDFLATRVSYRMGLTGPAVSVQTACSTSLVAVHLAVQSLLDGTCDAALAGGVSVMFPRRTGYRHQQGMILSSDGHCRPFDAAADGTVRGEGVGVVVLKRLDDALAAGDPVRAILRGTAVNNDGDGKAGYAATSSLRQRDVVVEAQQVAGVDASSIGYVETHGTGTRLGDPAEIDGLTRAFRLSTEDVGGCSVGSVKGNVGHLDAAAGIAALIKVVLMVEQGYLPPSINFDTPNPEIDFDSTPFTVNTDTRPWEDARGVRRAGVTSLGIGGTNAHAVVEQPPSPPPRMVSGGPALVMLSARSEEAVTTAVRELDEYVARHPELDVHDIARTLADGRVEHPVRRAVAALDADEATRRLDEARSFLAEPAGTGLVFPGQGSQEVGMGGGLYRFCPVFREAFDECAALFTPHIGTDLADLVFGEPTPAAQERLTRTDTAQPALFAVGWAGAEAMRSWGAEFQVLLGHSVGELVAACYAGVFSLSDAVRLVAERGRLMQDMPPGGMLVVATDEQEAAKLDPELDLASVNAERRCVLSGDVERLRAVAVELRRREVDHRWLRTSHAFHSRSMESAAAAFETVVGSVPAGAPRRTVISNVTGGPLTEAEATAPAYWARQLRHTVRFHEGVAAMLARCSAVAEVGSGSVAAVARRHPDRAPEQTVVALAPTVRPEDDGWARTLDALGMLWASGVLAHRERLPGTSGRRVPLPGYPFARRHHALPQYLPGPSGAGTAIPDDEPAELDRWFHRPGWRRLADDSPQPSRSGNLLVLGGPPALRRRLTDELTPFTSCCGPADRPEESDGPERSDAYARLLEAGDGIDEVVLLDEPDPDAALTGADGLGHEIANLVALGRALASRDWRIDLTVVTHLRAEAESGDRPDPGRTALLGALAVLGQELDGVRVAVIDADLGADPGPLVDCLVTGRRTDPRRPLIALRGTHRWTPTFDTVRYPEPADDFLTGRSVLVVGGRGGLGSALVDRIAARDGVRIATMSRDGGARDEQDGVVRLSGDIRREKDIRAAIQTARDRFGSLDVVVHAAGEPGERALRGLADIDAAHLAEQLAAKVDGTRMLASVVDALPAEARPEHCVLVSSNAGVLGGPGLCAYAVANHHLDAFAASRARDVRTRWTSVGWDAWSGHNQPRLPALPLDRALGTVDRVLAHAPGGHVVVSAQPFEPRWHWWRTPQWERPSRDGGRNSRVSRTDDAAQPAPPEVRGDQEIERAVLAVWEEVLGSDAVGLHDNFFDLGGDSMIGLRMVRILEERLEVSIDAVQLYETPTVAALGDFIRCGRDRETASARGADEDRARKRRDVARRSRERRQSSGP